MKKVKTYDITNAMLAELMSLALRWGEKHSLDNTAVVARSLRSAGDHLERIANKRGHFCPAGVRYGDDVPADKGDTN